MNEPASASVAALEGAPSFPLIAVVIPSYKVKDFILDVIASIPAHIQQVYVVDDACPSGSGKHVQEHCADPRVKVVFHDVNRGVGGAVMTGYRAAIDGGANIIVKIDGDGQMDPGLIDDFVGPICRGEADYTKGNRFYDLESLGSMPKLRVFGNAALSLMAKLSTGYWDLFDPTNGFTAIHADVARRLPYGRISERYFFETDMLFRLGTFRAAVVDVPMDAKYGDEVSNLKITRIFGEFLVKHIRNMFKRIFYNYFLRDMSVASLELVFGTLILLFGAIFGLTHWAHSASASVSTPVGTVIIAALCILCGFQLLLAFLNYDISHLPTRAIHKRTQKGWHLKRS
ncbi:glycosyltransferase family 2 protein [Dyella sp.]|uniref:glycosyltransferase family 2 protein n=1 Tax=Dyella sp. TaxID=1869338 RepID=UPI003F80F89E